MDMDTVDGTSVVFGSFLVDRNSSTPYTDATQVWTILQKYFFAKTFSHKLYSHKHPKVHTVLTRAKSAAAAPR